MTDELLGAAPDGARAGHERSPAVSAVPVTIPSVWLTIDSAPYNKTYVALLRRNDDGSVTYGHGYYMPLEGWRCWKHYAHKPPTHWFPLPDPFASANEARRAETQSGSVHESAIAESETPASNPQSVQGNQP